MFGLVDEYETEQFHSVEKDTTRLLASIARFEPVDAKEFRTLARFYLDLLEDEDGGYNKHLHDCLRQLIDRHVTRYVDSETGEGG
ncbi:hypothetical protein BLJAPNOD_05296 [Ensifer sp. M14]|nr:hypothetical protein BLJAPNOD_05296 [Ensifer sp. M14]